MARVLLEVNRVVGDGCILHQLHADATLFYKQLKLPS
jgi:hypothetical protein